jgi:tRNA A37 threonylcarbamoyltransferase TsaD
VRDLCASFQQSVVDVVVERLRSGLKIFRDRFGAPTALVAAGGVAANGRRSAKRCNAPRSKPARRWWCRRQHCARTTAP